MSRQIAYPYKRPDPERLACHAWKICIPHDTDAVNLEDANVHWDHGTRFTLEGSMKADLKGIRSDCELPAKTAICCIITLRCKDARYQEVIYRGKLDVGDSTTCQVKFTPDSTRLAGAILIETRLVLGENLVNSNGSLAPTRVYSSLIEHVAELTLEGRGSRFPTRSCAFHEIPAFETFRSAPWHLHVDMADFDEPFTRTVELILNESQSTTFEQIINAEQPVASMLSYSIASDLITMALHDESFTERCIHSPDFKTDSLGSQILVMINNCFPQQPVEAVQSLARDEPNRYASEIYSASMRSSLGSSQ